MRTFVKRWLAAALIPTALTLFGCSPDQDGPEAPGADADGDGWTAAFGDCDDTNPAIHPGAEELVNGIDDNCNGLVDEELGGNNVPLEVATDKIAGVDYCYATATSFPIGSGEAYTHAYDGDSWYVCTEFHEWTHCGPTALHLGEDWNREGVEDQGEPVRAVADGVVVMAKTSTPGWGKVIVVRHDALPGSAFALPGGGTAPFMYSQYAHLQNFAVSVGDSVQRGQQLAEIGPKAQGSTAPHLHWEMSTPSAPDFPGHGYLQDTDGRVDPTELISLNAALTPVCGASGQPCCRAPCGGQSTCGAGLACGASGTCQASGGCTQAAPVDVTPNLGSVNPAIAWGGSGWGAAYRDARGGAPYKVFFSRLNASGAMVAGSEVQLAGTVDYPDVAYASASGKYGVVWAGTQIWFACVDANGTVSAAQQITTMGQVGSARPRIVSTGSNFGVVWYDNSSGTNKVYMAALSGTSCTQIGSNVPISSGYGIDPAIAYSGSEFGITWQTYSTNNLVMFARASNSGAKIAGSEVQLADVGGGGVPRPRIAWNASQSEYAITYVDNSNVPAVVRFLRVGPSGTALGSPVPVSGQATVMDPNVVAAGANYGIAWYEPAVGVRFLEVDSAGATLSPLMTLSTGGYAPAIGWDGSGFMVVYPNSDVYTTRVACR